MKHIKTQPQLNKVSENLSISDVGGSKLYTEDEVKEIAWKAFMSRTDEKEFEMIHRKSAKLEFEKWWSRNV